MKLEPKTEELIRRIITIETGHLSPPKNNPFDKHHPHFRPDWEELPDADKRAILADIGFRRVAWSLAGLLEDFEEAPPRKRPIHKRLVDLWARNRRTAWQHS